jgi:hypothetical protein
VAGEGKAGGIFHAFAAAMEDGVDEKFFQHQVQNSVSALSELDAQNCATPAVSRSNS